MTINITGDFTFENKNPPAVNEVNDDQLNQVAGGNYLVREEGEIRIMYCSRGYKCNREFRSDAMGKWICTTCGEYKGVINTFA